ncbi:MAG: pyridoxamine kinase [Erysipelotrichaceae bacterium]|jgi:pyridoxine kinase|nr:pyridoxamine kinase [Erysipelotrichaceae bacterium]
MRQKRVCAIHDISCFGRCSLTVALPIISAAGIETSIIPTAVLSTHTSGFKDYTYRDLTDDILPIASHWQSLDLGFDALYSGFLGSIEQIEILCELCDRFKTEDNLMIVDPVMGDDGALYAIFPKDFPQQFRKLIAKADVIMPNQTEAALLLGQPYTPGLNTPEQIEKLLYDLAGLGAKKIVVTGVAYDSEHLGCAALDSATGEITTAFTEYLPGMMHGTGDVFGSALTAALVSGKSLHSACKVACRFTCDAIARTKANMVDVRFGVDFEHGLAGLCDLIENC